MNLEDIKTLRDLHELVKIGMITEGDFNIKKNEIINSQKLVSSDDRINLIRELHFLLQKILFLKMILISAVDIMKTFLTF